MAINNLFFSDAFAAANDRFQGMGSSIMDLFYIQDSILKPDAQTFLKKITGLLDNLYDSATDIAPDYDLNLTGYKAILRQGHQAYGYYVDPYVQNIKSSLKEENGASSLFVKASIAAAMTYATYRAYNNLYNNIDQMNKTQALRAITGCLVMSASSALLVTSIFEPSIEVSTYALSAMFIGGAYLWKKGMGEYVDTDLLNAFKTSIFELIGAFTPNRVLPTAFTNFVDNILAPEAPTANNTEANEDAPEPFKPNQLDENASQEDKTAEMFKMMQHLVKTVDAQAKKIETLEKGLDKQQAGAARDKLKAKGPGSTFADQMLGTAVGTNPAKNYNKPKA